MPLEGGQVWCRHRGGGAEWFQVFGHASGIDCKFCGCACGRRAAGCGAALWNADVCNSHATRQSQSPTWVLHTWTQLCRKGHSILSRLRGLRVTNTHVIVRTRLQVFNQLWRDRWLLDLHYQRHLPRRQLLRTSGTGVLPPKARPLMENIPAAATLLLTFTPPSTTGDCLNDRASAIPRYNLPESSKDPRPVQP